VSVPVSVPVSEWVSESRVPSGTGTHTGTGAGTKTHYHPGNVVALSRAARAGINPMCIKPIPISGWF
jgi:hypothetical protein